MWCMTALSSPIWCVREGGVERGGEGGNIGHFVSDNKGAKWGIFRCDSDLIIPIVVGFWFPFLVFHFEPIHNPAAQSKLWYTLALNSNLKKIWHWICQRYFIRPKTHRGVVHFVSNGKQVQKNYVHAKVAASFPMVWVRLPSLHFPASLYHHVVHGLRKPVVYVLNKVDLVPAAVLARWGRAASLSRRKVAGMRFKECRDEGVRR